MSEEVVLQAVGHVTALGNDADALGHELLNFGHEQRVVGASEDDGIDERILGEELAYAFLNEVVGSGRRGFSSLNDGSPERACNSADSDVGKEFLYFELITLALDGSFGGKQSYVTAACE